jgi:hypothetical protein
MLRLLTRHSADFDVCSEPSDLTKSPYVEIPGYVEKVSTLYRTLGVQSAIWAFPEDSPFEVVECDKATEYLFQVHPDRLLAYVDSASWNQHLIENRVDFDFSNSPQAYSKTILLVRAPLFKTELMEKRYYYRSSSPKYRIIETY